MTTTDERPVTHLPLPDPAMTPAERVWDAIHYAEAHPEEWDQRSWGKTSCRTTYCTAGRILVRAGFPLEPMDEDDDPTYLNGVPLSALPPDMLADTLCDSTDTHATAERVVNTLLGITSLTGDRLWYAPNDMIVLRRIATEIFGPDPGVGH